MMLMLFSIYELFQSLVSYWCYTSQRNRAYDVSPMEAKLFHRPSLLSASVGLMLLLVRINGIAFLIYLGFQTIWYYPLVVWGCVFIGVNIVHVLIRKYIGQAIPSFIGLFVLPIVGVWIWFTAS